MIFDEEYYKSGNYKDYLDRSHRYECLAAELGAYFKKNHIFGVLDFGCAVGFLVNHLQKHKFRCLGYDVSDWAITYGIEVLQIPYLTTSDEILDLKYDVVLFLDVLEHMEIEQINEALQRINTQYITVRIPVCSTDEGKYVCNISENDSSHIIRWTKQSWIDLFIEHGYHKIKTLNFKHIWDSPCVLCAVFKK